MVVTDSKLDHAMRPSYLTFDGEIAPGEPFAHMIENGPMIAALLDKARAEGVDLRPVAVTQVRNEPARSTAGQLSDGTARAARLLVAADGARSALREQAGIASHGWDYDQAGIVTTVAHERDTTVAPRSTSSPPVRSRCCH